MDRIHFQMFVVLITIAALGNGGASPVATWNDYGNKVHLVKKKEGHVNDFTPLSVYATFGFFEKSQPPSMPMAAILPPVTRTDLIGFAVLRGIASLSALVSGPNPNIFIGMNQISYMSSAVGMTSSLSNAVTMGAFAFDLGPLICGVLSDYASQTKHIISIAKEQNKTLVLVDNFK